MLQTNSRSVFGLAALLGIASAVFAPGAQAAPARGTLLGQAALTPRSLLDPARGLQVRAYPRPAPAWFFPATAAMHCRDHWRRCVC
ncbi:hypothetical protein FLG15_02080 [Xanthomonas phaseoli pv. dieffenbachiae]